MLTAEITRFILMIGVFASIVLISSVVIRSIVDSRVYVNAINRRMKMISKGASREEIVVSLRKNDPNEQQGILGPLSNLMTGFRRKLMMAAVPYTSSQIILAMMVLFALILLGTLVSVWALNYPLGSGVIQLLVAFSAATSIGLPVLVIGYLSERRRKKMQQQFPVALDIFVRALRSGHPVASAIELVTREMQDPIGSEFGLVFDEISYGADLTEALDDMAERWDMDDIRMFVVSLSIQSETGGNLAEILDNLSHVIRERASLYLKVRALSSEGRMTGWLLVALPIITFVSLFMMNPEFYLGVAGDPIFYIGFPVMIAWYFVGVYFIRRMVNLKV